MEELKRKNEQEKRAEIDQVLAELCLDAPSTIVKQCLQCYQYGKSLKQLKAAFMAHRLNVLKDTYEHMVPENTNIPKTKESLSHSIICKFQNYMSDMCDCCKQTYRFKHNDIPLMECRVCGQEVHRPCFLKSIGEDEHSEISAHDALQKVNPLGLPFLFYICKPCASKVIPEEVVPSHNATKDETSSTGEHTIENNTADEVLNPTEPSELQALSPLSTEIDNSTEIVETPKQKVIDTDNSKVCSFYEKGVCKHGKKGEGCKFAHPKFCRKFLSHGKKKGRGCDGKDCQYHHPPMCQTSLNTGTCYKKNCTKRHVKNTTFEKVQSKKKADVQEKRSNSDQNDFLLEFLEKMKMDLSKEIESKFQTIFSSFQIQRNQNPWQVPVQPMVPPFQQGQMMAGLYNSNLPQFRPGLPKVAPIVQA